MPMRLVELTPDNIRLACRIDVKPEQQKFVAPVVASIAEAYVHFGTAWPRLIMDDDRVVGFVLGNFDPDSEIDAFRAGIWRLNVAADEQGRGYGKYCIGSGCTLICTRSFCVVGLAELVGVRGGVAEPRAAVLDSRVGDVAPEWPDGRRDPKFDPGASVAADEVIDNDLVDSFHRLLTDPVAADLVRPEAAGGQPVGIQAASLHARQPLGLDDVDPGGGAVAEEPFQVLRRGCRHRPDAAARAVPGEPEHGRVPGIDRPDERLSTRIAGRRARLEPAKRGVFAVVPQSERAFAGIRRRRLTSEQVDRVFHGPQTTYCLRPFLQARAASRQRPA
jgi:diamine N-acetyltransferase